MQASSRINSIFLGMDYLTLRDEFFKAVHSYWVALRFLFLFLRPYRLINKPYFSQSGSVKQVSSVEDKSRFLHLVIDPLPIVGPKFIPFRQNSNSMGFFTSCISILKSLGFFGIFFWRSGF